MIFVVGQNLAGIDAVMLLTSCRLGGRHLCEYTTRRYPQNRNYITYHKVARGDGATTEISKFTWVVFVIFIYYYLFIYYANNLSRQMRDMNSNTNSKNKLARKTHKHNSKYGTDMWVERQTNRHANRQTNSSQYFAPRHRDACV